LYRSRLLHSPSSYVRAVLTIGAVASCTPYDPTLSNDPFFCGSADPKCPDGYACMQPVGTGSAVCVATTPMGGNCTMPFTGMLGTWDLTSQPGSQVSSPAKMAAPGVTAGGLSRSAALVATSGTNSIAASNWTTGAMPDMTMYFTLSITPPAGCTVSMTGMAVDVASSGTGPTVAAVATSADAFAHTSPISTALPSTPTLAVSKSATAIELRIYGYGAMAATGTMRVQNMMTITGSLQ
jgi:hypothetical protein